MLLMIFKRSRSQQEVIYTQMKKIAVLFLMKCLCFHPLEVSWGRI